MVTFTNEKQIQDYFNNIIKKIIANVGNNLLKDFQIHLDRTIYATKEGQYKRYKENGGFYSGWHIVALDDYCRTLRYDPSRLVEHSQDWANNFIAHGGNVREKGRDYRGVMPDILNDRAKNDYFSTYGGAYYTRNGNEPYWNLYLKSIKKKAEKWFDEEFKKYGIKPM